MSVTGERQVTGENGRGPSGQKGLIWIWKVFGYVISFGSGQLAAISRMNGKATVKEITKLYLVGA